MQLSNLFSELFKQLSQPAQPLLNQNQSPSANYLGNGNGDVNMGTEVNYASALQGATNGMGLRSVTEDVAEFLKTGQHYMINDGNPVGESYEARTRIAVEELIKAGAVIQDQTKIQLDITKLMMDGDEGKLKTYLDALYKNTSPTTKIGLDDDLNVIISSVTPEPVQPPYNPAPIPSSNPIVAFISALLSAVTQMLNPQQATSGNVPQMSNDSDYAPAGDSTYDYSNSAPTTVRVQEPYNSPAPAPAASPANTSYASQTPVDDVIPSSVAEIYANNSGIAGNSGPTGTAAPVSGSGSGGQLIEGENNWSPENDPQRLRGRANLGQHTSGQVDMSGEWMYDGGSTITSGSADPVLGAKYSELKRAIKDVNSLSSEQRASSATDPINVVLNAIRLQNEFQYENADRGVSGQVSHYYKSGPFQLPISLRQTIGPMTGEDILFDAAPGGSISDAQSQAELLAHVMKNVNDVPDTPQSIVGLRDHVFARKDMMAKANNLINDARTAKQNGDMATYEAKMEEATLNMVTALETDTGNEAGGFTDSDIKKLIADSKADLANAQQFNAATDSELQGQSDSNVALSPEQEGHELYSISEEEAAKNQAEYKATLDAVMNL